MAGPDLGPGAGRRDRIHGAAGLVPTPLWIALLVISAVVLVHLPSASRGSNGESALLTLVLLGILVLEFGSPEMLHLEQYQPDANITSASDALWSVIVAISTVGDGDRFPVTRDGRLLGGPIIVVGVGIFGTFTGYLANLFLTTEKTTKAPESATTSDEAELAATRRRQLVAEQRPFLDDVERLLDGEQGAP